MKQIRTQTQSSRGANTYISLLVVKQCAPWNILYSGTTMRNTPVAASYFGKCNTHGNHMPIAKCRFTEIIEPRAIRRVAAGTWTIGRLIAAPAPPSVNFTTNFVHYWSLEFTLPFFPRWVVIRAVCLSCACLRVGLLSRRKVRHAVIYIQRMIEKYMIPSLTYQMWLSSGFSLLSPRLLIRSCKKVYVWYFIHPRFRAICMGDGLDIIRGSISGGISPVLNCT